MKTGFVKAFIDKTAKKYYNYHGLIMPCNLQPEPDTLIEYPITSGGTWVVIYEWWTRYYGESSYSYSWRDFLPSSINDLCSTKFPDGKVRHYKLEVEYTSGVPGSQWYVIWVNGKICNWDGIFSYDNYMYITADCYLWAETTQLIKLWNAKPGTHIRIWGTSNGELPG